MCIFLSQERLGYPGMLEPLEAEGLWDFMGTLKTQYLRMLKAASNEERRPQSTTWVRSVRGWEDDWLSHCTN